MSFLASFYKFSQQFFNCGTDQKEYDPNILVYDLLILMFLLIARNFCHILDLWNLKAFYRKV